MKLGPVLNKTTWWLQHQNATPGVGAWEGKTHIKFCSVSWVPQKGLVQNLRKKGRVCWYMYVPDIWLQYYSLCDITMSIKLYTLMCILVLWEFVLAVYSTVAGKILAFGSIIIKVIHIHIHVHIIIIKKKMLGKSIWLQLVHVLVLFLCHSSSPSSTRNSNVWPGLGASLVCCHHIFLAALLLDIYLPNWSH